MKSVAIMTVFTLVACTALAERPERNSENDPQLARALKARPQLDLNHDGILTMEETSKARERRQRPRTHRIAPTHADMSYGEHPSMTLDFWKAEAERPTPLFIWIHGGGFRSGDKAPANPVLLSAFLDAGVSVASINYRLTGVGPYPLQMHDSVRAVQWLRSKARDWNIDPTRIAAGGGSAGSGISQWLAFHDDLANPESADRLDRFSSRIRCALALNMQSTYDPRVIKTIVPGDAFDDAALKLLYGLPEDWDWETATVGPDLDALIKDASPINHLTRDDPPVFIFHAERTRVPGNIHHPNFGTHLEAAMTALDIECVRRTSAYYDSWDGQYREMVQFTLRHLGSHGTTPASGDGKGE